MWNCYIEDPQPFNDYIRYTWHNDRSGDVIEICFVPNFAEDVTEVRLTYRSFDNYASMYDVFRIPSIDVFYSRLNGRIKLNRTVRSYFIARIKDFLTNSIPR